MSDNKLLNENTIRRFMKLANVESMTNNFISEMGMKYKREEEEEEIEETTTTDEDVVTEEETADQYN